MVQNLEIIDHPDVYNPWLYLYRQYRAKVEKGVTKAYIPVTFLSILELCSISRVKVNTQVYEKWGREEEENDFHSQQRADYKG